MKNMEPFRISVVVPTYQRPVLLLRCLDALVHQNFPKDKYEIIVVSDGEDEPTSHSLGAVAIAQIPVIRYYSLPGKAGPAAARNLGWLLAQSDLVAFTDDDCIPDGDWLQAMWSSYSTLAENKQVAFSGHTVVPINREPTDYEKNISRLASAEFITANCACSVEALKSVDGFDERFKMAWRGDSDLQFKFIEHGIPIVKVNHAVVTHPVRKAPWGISIKEERKGMFNALLYKKYPLLYRQKIQQNPPWNYYAITFFVVLLMAGLLTGKDVLRITGLSGWMLLTIWYAWRRLRSTSHSWNHVSEMIFTSAVIPLFALFWKLYGAWKYRVFRLH